MKKDLHKVFFHPFMQDCFGYTSGSNTIIKNIGLVDVDIKNYIGGLVGMKKPSATVTNSYWDMTTSGRIGAESGCGTDKFTVQKKTMSTYSNWSNSIWNTMQDI